MEATGARKIILITTAALGAMALTALGALLAQPASARDFSGITGVMLYWLLAGAPLVSLWLASSAGAETAGLEPAPGYKRLMKALGAVVLAAAVIFIGAWASTGFRVPDFPKINFYDVNPIDYAPALLYLVLHGFTIAYTTRKTAAGFLLAALSLALAVLPLLLIASFQQLRFELLPLGALSIAAAIAAFAGPFAALKLRTSGAARAAALVLVLPALLAVGGLAALHLRASREAFPVEVGYYSCLFPDTYLLGDAMLVHKPYSGRIYLIDKAGKRAELVRGSFFPRLRLLLPAMDEDNVMATRGRDGTFWLLHQSGNTASLFSGGINGFTERAKIPLEEGFPVWLLGFNRPGLMRHTSKGVYFADLPYGGAAINWGKRYEGRSADARENELLLAGLPSPSLRGSTLVYGKDHWQVPGNLEQTDPAPFPAFQLNGKASFFVPAEGKHGLFTYYCRSGAAAQAVWPGYARQPLSYYHLRTTIWPTPGGAAWWRAEDRTTGFHREPVFLIVNEEGKALPPVRFPGAMIKEAGTDQLSDAILLRASGDDLWFNLAGKYLARLSAGKPDQYKLWKFPELTPVLQHHGCCLSSYDNYALSVKPVGGGAMLAALDGVYFMDWNGNSKKLY